MQSRPPPRNRIALAILVVAATISQIGSAFTLIAVPWFVLQTTGSAAKTGLTGVFAALPYIIAGIFGGALVDRLGFKRTSVIADITSGVTIALIPLLYHTTGLAFWQLLALTFLASLWNSPGGSARQSLVPELAMLAQTSLERANSIVQSVPRFATLFGPPIAGVLIAVMGAGNVIWLDAATFAISAVLIGAFVPPLALPARTAPTHFFADLTEGWRFITREPLMRAMTTVFAIGNFFDAPLSLLVAVYANRRYGSAVPLGFIFAALGAGAVIGSLGYGAIGHRVPRRAIMVLYLFPVATMYMIFALAPPLPVILVAIFLDGIAVGPVNPMSATVSQERVPVELRGRVQGLTIALAWVAIPVGRGLAGLLIAPVGLATIFAAISAGFILLGIGVLLHPAFRDMQTPNRKRHVSGTPVAHRAT